MSAPPRRRVIGIFGLLLTPIVAWAASFLGGWIGALAAGIDPFQDYGFWLMLGGSLLSGAIAAIIWIRLLVRYRTAEIAPKEE